MPDDGTSDWVEVAIHPDDNALRRRARNFARRSSTPLDVEFRVRHLSGEYRWIRSRGYPRRGADRRIIKWYGVAKDIQPQRTAALQLQRLQAELS